MGPSRLLRVALVVCTLASFTLAACDGDPPASDAGGRDEMDAGMPDAGSDTGPTPAALCDELELPRRAFDPAASGSGFEQTAGDFTVETLDGAWTLSEQWSGCESYVFLLKTSSAYGEGLFATTPDELFTLGRRNVHYFFGDWDPDELNTRAQAESMRAVVEDAFEFQGLSAEDRVFWREHVHFVTQPMSTVEGPLNAFLTGVGRLSNAFAITREQRLDPVGSLMAIGRAGFTPALGMARFAGPYYDYLIDLDTRLGETEGVTVLPLLDAETTTARTLDRDVTLPSVDAFDTLEVEVELTCLLSPDGCSEWDRIAYVYLCEDEACEGRLELVRWITPYSRPGRRRWIMDATPMLALLRGGGARTFRMVFGPNWEEATERTVSVSLRLSNQGRPDVPMEAQLAFTGGGFGADYNEGRLPHVFTAPAGTTRTELVTIVSGHGQEANNCAEWCDHVHTFGVAGGDEYVIDFPGQAGTDNGCAELASAGVPPGQFGNWSPLRAGWCPGYPVAAIRHDITGDVTPGIEAEVTYSGSYAGAAPPGGNIVLSTYVVFYGAP